jgi:hypothetical protein
MTTSTESAADRVNGLSDRARRLRSRASAGRLDRWLLIAGALLMPLGIACILLGWASAAHTTVLDEQNDYIISGGIGGLALVVAGGFSYFAYWQATRIREARAQTASLARALGRIETLLAGGAAGDVTGIDTVAETFVATAGGSLYHRRDCAAVAGRTDLSQVDLAATALGPCRICMPPDPA